MKIKIQVLLLLLCLQCIAQKKNISPLDAKYGFRDIKLETSLESLTNRYELVNIQLSRNATTNSNIYSLRGANMFIDNLPIKYITVEFMEGKLYCINLEIDTTTEGSKLGKLIEKNYGKLSEPDADYNYFVYGKKTELKFRARGSADFTSSSATISIRSTVLRKKTQGINSEF